MKGVAADGATTERLARSSRGLWIVVATVSYSVLFVALGPLVGAPIMALLLVPAALAGWWLGALGGGLVALALIALNALLAIAVGQHGALPAATFPGAIPGGLVTLAAAAGIGAFHERHLQLDAAEQQAREDLEQSEALASALGASEQRFRLLAEEALVGVYLIQDRRFEYVNRAFANAFGYEVSEIVARLGPDDLTLPEDRPLVRDNIENRLSRGVEAAHYGFRGVRKDGSLVPVEVLGRVLDVDGRPAILGTLLDHTRRVQDEATLRLRMTALEAASAGIVVTDATGVIQWANPHALALTGYALDEVVGRHTRLFNSGHQSEAFYRSLWETITAGHVWHGELVNRRKDGSEYLEEMSITPVQGAAGTIERFVAVKQDVTEKRAAEDSIRALNETLEVQLRRMTALHQIDTAITDGRAPGEAMTAFLTAAREGLGVDAVGLFLTTPEGDALELAQTQGFRAPPPRIRLPLGEGLAGRAVASGRPRIARGNREIFEALYPETAFTLDEEGFETFAAAPMTVRGSLRGALVAGQRSVVETPADWQEYLVALATQGAILIDNTTLLSDLRARNAELRTAYDATIEGWSRALDLRDRETEGHSRRVTELTLRLGQAMGLSEEALVHVRRGALLHDIGKMGIPDAILQKPGPLTDEEWDVMRRHTMLARDLLEPITFLGPALEIPISHHERWDGQGYPEGLAGEAIPLAARMFAVADVFDALTSDRPYRLAWTRQQALEHIRENAGSHFDPAVVQAFLCMFQM
ncbi:MAG: PAS domain S-box protein [Deinococcales bacterium]